MQGDEAHLALAVLRLKRMLPVIDASDAPLGRALEGVIRDYVAPDQQLRQNSSRTLSAARERLSGSIDVRLPGYYQARAALLGLIIVDSGTSQSFEDSWRADALAGNFWSSLDELLANRGAFEENQILRSLKATLRGIENAWVERDIELLARTTSAQSVVIQRIAEIENKGALRTEIARLVARYLEW